MDIVPDITNKFAKKPADNWAVVAERYLVFVMSAFVRAFFLFMVLKWLKTEFYWSFSLFLVFWKTC
jgi:hypothetical protein